ncbi:TPM domain-containing protein [Lacticaseibacillus absianus]|uniref:TPM domain-containing protein n=1 Tax=Lacticaseibacillus absianus TaxID=2729623 RepID=UPI0015C6BA60
MDHLPTDTTIEQFTLEQATTLGVGDADEDSGVVYLIAKAERQARLEVGYGMESRIPDAMTDVVTDDQVKTDYRRGDYNAGVQLVTQRLDQLIRTGAVDASRIAHLQTHTGFHPLTAIWTWLNTTHGVFSLLVALAGLGLALYTMHRLSRHLQARVRLDALVQHYLSAMHAIDPQLDATAILASPHPTPVKTARTTLRAQLLPTNVNAVDKMGVPDYYSMQFAFGRTTIAKFYANARTPDRSFKQTSMYRRHQDDWYRVTPLFDRQFRLPQTKQRDRVPSSDVRPYLLPPLTQAWWWLVRLITNGWVLILLVLGLYWLTGHANSISALRVHLQLTSWGRRAMQFLERLLASGQSPLQLLNAFVMSLLFGGLLLVSYLALNATNTRAHRHLQLNRMIRNFLGDLRVRLKQHDDDRALATALATATQDAAITKAKTSLKTSLGGKAHGKKRKGDLPDYYDMAFAFGSVTVTQFFHADETTKTYKTSSMYVNHADDWYASGSSGGDGGGDSFGGGDFGGGGGTSSW